MRVFESGAIMLYLAQKHPEAGLYSQVLVYCLSMSAPGQFYLYLKPGHRKLLYGKQYAA